MYCLIVKNSARFKFGILLRVPVLFSAFCLLPCIMPLYDINLTQQLWAFDWIWKQWSWCFWNWNFQFFFVPVKNFHLFFVQWNWWYVYEIATHLFICLFLRVTTQIIGNDFQKSLSSVDSRKIVLSNKIAFNTSL